MGVVYIADSKEWGGYCEEKRWTLEEVEKEGSRMHGNYPPSRTSWIYVDKGNDPRLGG